MSPVDVSSFITDFATADPLPGALRPDRPYYDTGVLLDADDFADEQTYHRARLARALGYLGGDGTLVGLKTRITRTGGVLEWQVGGGLALDRFGRLIEVPRAWCVRLERWVAAQSDDALRAANGPAGVVADVFLRFAAQGRGRTPAFAQGAFDATDALVPSRVRDAFVFEPVLRPDAAADPTALAHLPRHRFADLRALPPAARVDGARQALLDAWDTRLARPDGEALQPRSEHPPGLDPASIFLARLTLPVSGMDATTSRPLIDFDAVDDSRLNNTARTFVMPTDMLGAIFGA
jgi:hypothetical protein